MKTNLEDYDGVVDRIADDFTTPDVAGIYQIAEKRHQRRRTVQQCAAVLALLLTITGTTLWINQPLTSEVATEPPLATSDEATTTTNETAAVTNTDELRDLFISTPSWTPIARSGIPEGGGSFEAVTFQRARGNDNMFFASCLIVPPYIIDWEQDGFTVNGKDLQAELDARGCDQPGQEGIGAAPVQTGEKVTITDNRDDTYTLTGNAWTLTITPMTQAPANPEPTETPTTTIVQEPTTTISE